MITQFSKPQMLRLSDPSTAVVFLVTTARFCRAGDANAPRMVDSTLDSPFSDSEANLPCGFLGDNNTYGLGIRLGIYLQWLMLMIASSFVPEEAVNMRQVNNFFTLSNLIGARIQTIVTLVINVMI